MPGDLPLVRPTGGVPGRWCDHVAPIGPGVHPRQYRRRRLVSVVALGPAVEEVPAAGAGDLLDRVGELPAAERFTLAVDVDHDQPRLPAGDDPYVRVGPRGPPPADSVRVRRGAVPPGGDTGMLARPVAIRPPRARAHVCVDDPMAREDRPAAGGVRERGGEEGPVVHTARFRYAASARCHASTSATPACSASW